MAHLGLHVRALVLTASLAAAAAASPAPATTAVADAPAPDAAAGGHAVSYAKDVKVLLAHNCYDCHAKGKRKGGFALDSREQVLKGGESGPGVVVGKADESELVKRLLTDDPDLKMPPPDTGKALRPEEVATLRDWVNQGLSWDEVTPAQLGRKPQNLTARKPEVPPGDGHPVDRLLAGYFKANGVTPTVVSDDVFARRVYLDITGLGPTPQQSAAFAADSSPTKRAALVKALLADGDAYAEHWMTFWQDHLRDGKKDIGTTDIFKPITAWLYESLRSNKPYNQFAAELVTAAAPKDGLSANEVSALEKDRAKGLTDPTDAGGFLIGQLSGLEQPRGDQAWPVQAAQNLGQVFLGVQLKCATCHDSFIDQWTMADSWAFANVFAAKPLEAVRCEQPTGKFYPARFLYPDMGSIDPNAPVAERQRRMADLLTSPANGRFSRTMANRMWAKLIGRGLVADADEMDAEAWSPDVLDWLAEDFVASGYDVRHLIERICTSAAYQMPSVDAAAVAAGDAKAGGGAVAAGGGYVFRGPAVRRLSAEQFVDGVQRLLGRDERAWRGGGTRLMEMLGRPDRRVVLTRRDDKSSTIQALELLNGQGLYDLLYTDGTVRRATADNAKSIRGGGEDGAAPDAGDAGGDSGDGPAPAKPAAKAVVAAEKPATKPAAATKPAKAAAKKPAATTKPATAAKSPATKPAVAKAPATKPAAVAAAAAMGAAKTPATKPAVSMKAAAKPTVAAIPGVNADAAALAKLPPRDLADRLLRQGLSRPPAEREVTILAEVLGERPTPQAVADAVWMVAMLPEFQLVR